VYLRVPERQLEAKAPLIRLVLESLTTEMFDTYDTPQGRTCRPVLVMIDEAGTVGFSKLPHYSSTCAGRGISFWVALQDLSQLDGLYQTHKARTVRNNMGAKVFFRPEDYATAKSISDTLGFTSGYSHSETIREGEVSSQGRSEQAIAVLTPRELMELGDRDTIFFVRNLKPGRGNRMEYWRFPLLEKRRRIPPPPVKALPEVPAMTLPTEASSWERQREWPRFPIDPDDLN
jgi:type IV secretory pathway TraG/TraD family ATPase VirD4